MILVDTSVLIASLTSPRQLLPALDRVVKKGVLLVVPTVVLYEWWRGPRLEQELTSQEIIFPSQSALIFGVPEARVAADLYRGLGRARSRELDIAIAACAITREAALWTLNPGDFKDIPGLTLVNPDANPD